MFCSCVGRSTNVKPTSWRPAVTLMRGDIMRLSNSSRATGLFSVARLVVLLAADRRREDLLAVDRDDELMRRLVSFDADQPFGHGLQQPSGEHVLAVGRERDDGTSMPPRVPSGSPSTCWFCVTTVLIV